MNRPTRILVPVLALVLLIAGSALANKASKPDQEPPVVTQDQDEEGAAPSPQLLDKIVERLGDAGIDTDSQTVADLAATYGVGGAVRLLMWADATGMDPADLGAMFDSGMGWGEIAQQLNDEDAEGDLSLRPGIGSVMGGNGQGHAHGQAIAPGLAKKQQ
jgi:hypothetical protein